MKLALIICTYQRPGSLESLIKSICGCILKPDIILVIDGSLDDNSRDVILKSDFDDLQIKYFKVSPDQRGLTRQRNLGLKHLPDETEIVSFLDDDIRVEPDYFERLLETYEIHPDAIGAGGIDLKDNGYLKKEKGAVYNKFNYYELDGWVIKEPLRNKARKIFGLMPNLQPGLIPGYSNGRSAFPPDGHIYEVEHFMGGIASYRRKVFSKIEFSSFFEGYGLYEDFDFCVRSLQLGKLYVNTNARVWHYHEPSGRPDGFRYGKMVIRNGWYVWRVRFPNPSIKAKLQWHSIMILLSIIRLFNVITGPDREGSFLEFTGRTISWLSLLFKSPKIINECN
jgi:GT2 family glycosyltransferase